MVLRYAYIYPEDSRTKYSIYQNENDWVYIEERDRVVVRQIKTNHLYPTTKLLRMEELKECLNDQ